jgi:hypothetical protein
MINFRRLICCCGQTKRTVNEYFRQACYRSRNQLPPIKGEIVRNADRLQAQFFIDVRDGYIKAACYKCTTCVPLVVYCERLNEIVVGLSLNDVIQIEPTDLKLYFPEIPFYKHDRAFLAVKALKSAVSNTRINIV